MNFDNKKIESLNEQLMNYFILKNNIILNNNIINYSMEIIKIIYTLKSLQYNENYSVIIKFSKITNRIEIESTNKEVIKDFFNFHIDEDIIKDNEILVNELSLIFSYLKFSKEININLRNIVSVTNKSMDLWKINNTVIGLIETNKELYNNVKRKIYLRSNPDIIFINDEILSFHSINLNIYQLDIFKNKYDSLKIEDVDVYNYLIIKNLDVKLRLMIGRKVIKLFTNLNENDIMGMENNKLMEYVDISFISNY